jgi:hypothetical protein
LALRLAELKPQNLERKPFKVGQLLGNQGRHAIQRLIPGKSSVTENCFIVEQKAFSQFRNDLLNPTKTWADDFLHSHAISERAATALKQGDYERFLSERRNTLIELEKNFIEPLGLYYD